MARKYIDCREHPGDIKCTIAIAADTDDELMEATLQHVKAVHGMPDSQQVRDMIRQGIKEGRPAA